MVIMRVTTYYFIAFIVTTLSDWQTANGQLDQDQKGFILRTHNQFRSQVSPTASNMLEMVWSEELANMAQSYSQQCVFMHSGMRSAQSGMFQSIGENIGFLGPLSTWGENELLRLLNIWGDENNEYSLSANTCLGMCDHYTQVVWAQTDKVGCGVTLCPTLNIPGPSSVSSRLNLVCNYSPAGNIISRRPYATGISCSACPSGYICSDNLCTLTGPSSVQPLTANSLTVVTSDPKRVGPETTLPATIGSVHSNLRRVIAIYFRIIDRLQRMRFIDSRAKGNIISNLLRKIQAFKSG